MDKPLFDSDADPKRIKKVADGLRRQGEFESARMLDGYADLLEAREKAVPVAVVKDSDALYTGWLSWTGEPAPPETKLYTHPAHFAQAQPPAASVTDAMVEDGCMAWNKSAGLGYAVADRDCMRAAIEAALAAQENPNG